MFGVFLFWFVFLFFSPHCLSPISTKTLKLVIAKAGSAKQRKMGIKFLNIARAEGEDMSFMKKMNCLRTK